MGWPVICPNFFSTLSSALRPCVSAYFAQRLAISRRIVYLVEVILTGLGLLTGMLAGLLASLLHVLRHL